MKLYHFTCIEHLDDIKREGLSRGEVTDRRNGQVLTFNQPAVWLTSDPNPEGHGLGDGGELSVKAKESLRKDYPEIDPTEPIYLANKHAVRITVTIPTSDRKLRYWPRWGRSHISPDWYASLGATTSPTPGGSTLASSRLRSSSKSSC